MTLKRITRQWVVTANGVECARVDQGQSVEIGRRPIRPIVDSGLTRVEISDATKSMSKRHATLSVDESGMATVRDLNSTNGSYVVRADGGLMKLQPGVDFLLPTSSMRMQFGDVPIDLTRVETESEEQDAHEVKDLFRYARTESEKPEHDLTGLSVSDILDVRVGEPTIVFHAQTAGHQEQDQRTGEDGPVTAEDGGTSPHGVDDQDGGMPAGDAPQSAPESLLAQLPDESGRTDGSAGLDDGDSHVDDSSSAPAAFGSDANHEEHGDGEGGTNLETAIVEDVEAAKAAEAADGVDGADGVDEADGADGTSPSTAQVVENSRAEEPGLEQVAGSRVPESVREESDADLVRGSSNARGSVFEPGSVFHQVSSGSLGPQRPQVEVGGFTSEQARTSGDYTEQFAMARHTELLRFLAMNPGLYDDLYAWLAAQGDKDVDEALDRNAGYREYRTTIGK